MTMRLSSEMAAKKAPARMPDPALLLIFLPFLFRAQPEDAT